MVVQGDAECDLQNRYKHREPELLRTEQRIGIGSPLSELQIVTIPQDHKTPGSLVLVSILFAVVQEGHTAMPSHPMKRWCLSNMLWWVLLVC